MKHGCVCAGSFLVARASEQGREGGRQDRDSDRKAGGEGRRERNYKY